MKKCRLFLLLLLLSLLCLAVACGNNANSEKTKNSHFVFVPQWESSLTENGFFHLVRQNNGRILYAEHDGLGDFEYTLLESDFLQATFPAGTGHRGSKFFDLEEGKISTEYYNIVATAYKKVAYIAYWQTGNEADRTNVVVHNAFNANEDRNEFAITYADPVAFPGWDFPFEKAEFIDEGHLYIEYLNSQGELIKETLELK